MDELWKKIYKEVISYERETIKVYKEVDQEISLLVKQYEGQVNQKELEKLKELLSAVSLTAEQAGFKVGVRFVIQLLCSLLRS